jgi:MFS superfamily sulfate permease-like transporter
MATAVVSRQKLRTDNIFFPAMALLILGVVVVGFAQSYFLAGMFRAKLPNTLVHIHGALFVSWIFFLVIQTSLVAIGRVKWHMTLGIFGVILPPLMVVFGVLTLFDSIRRNGTGLPPELLLVGDLENLALFVALTAWALLVRRNAASHKRLMILGTMAILGPAIDRWPIPHTILGTLAIILGLPLLVVAYDLWSTRRVHRSTAVAFAMIAAVVFTVLPVSRLGFWQQAIAWIRHT